MSFHPPTIFVVSKSKPILNENIAFFFKIFLLLVVMNSKTHKTRSKHSEVFSDGNIIIDYLPCEPHPYVVGFCGYLVKVLNSSR